MKRRDFLGGLAIGASGISRASEAWARRAQQEQPISPEIRRVLVLFKCHFDLGFIDTQAGVMRKYFEQYFPHAIEITRNMRDAGEDRYVWTTGSWLLYEYLEQAGTEERKRMEEAVGRGDIAWHALPFSWQTELLDQSMIGGAIGLSRALDRRFRHTTTGAKMTDVPGHTRGIVAPLAENGVTFLDIGVNSASTPPKVPALFVWTDAEGKTLTVMYHHKSYGGVVRVPGSDLAVAVEVRNDNSGPHLPGEIRKIFGELRQQFPNASVRASNLTEIANAVAPFRNNLPVVTEEIGDTWIYGVPSDPLKVARYREIVRLRRDWIAQGEFKAADATDIALLRRFALAAEHTWGTDTKTWLDFDHYTPHDLAEMVDRPNYRTVTHSWAEKRDDIEQGVAALPARLRDEARGRLEKLKPIEPVVSSWKAHRAEEEIEGAHFTVALDPKTGAIGSLRQKSTGREWAGADHPLALFSYQTLSKDDYDRFLASYVTSKADWAPKDFGKPQIERFGAQSRMWRPTLTKCWSHRDPDAQRMVAEMQIQDEASQREGRTAWPQKMYLEVVLPNSEPVVELNFSWFGKTSNRLPEALWLTFRPNAPEAQGWMLEKSGQRISPSDVVAGGNRHMHALSDRMSYRDGQGSLSIETLDAPVVALGEQSPIYFSEAQPDIARGIHFSLFNNSWGTNYIQWFGENMRFRFTLRT